MLEFRKISFQEGEEKFSILSVTFDKSIVIICSLDDEALKMKIFAVKLKLRIL